MTTYKSRKLTSAAAVKHSADNTDTNDHALTTDESPAKTSTAGTEKLQKALARMGLGSRRQMEEIIKAGRVSVNSGPATIGDRVAQGDEIRVDGRLIKYKPENEKRRRILAYYKPEGEICSANDPEGRPTVFDRLPKLTHDRWVMVGRLDINSTGLLLFTNDGELANKLMHPSANIEREYWVRVAGEVTEEMIEALRNGMELEDGFAKFNDVIPLFSPHDDDTQYNRYYSVTLNEGRNREVRRLWEAVGCQVSRLKRTRYGTVELPKPLAPGKFRKLDNGEQRALLSLLQSESRS